MSKSSTPSSQGFSETLQYITTIKLQELENQGSSYKTHAKVVEQSRQETNLITRVELLLTAVRTWSGSGALDSSADVVVGSKLDLGNLDLWLLQAKSDPAFSPDVLTGWITALEEHIEHLGTRFEYARLFGGMLNEWLSSGDSAMPEVKAEDARLYGESFDEWLGGEDEAPAAEPVLVGRKEMYEQRGKLESIIFEDKAVNVDAIEAYLETLFSEPKAAAELKALRMSISERGAAVLRTKVDADDVKWIIASLLKSNLMSEGKRATLREFLTSPLILEEVASVINMRLAGAEQWSWPAEGMVMEMRRELNGRYRAFTDPEILDALLLEYLGRTWQVVFKDVFKRIASSKAWKPSHTPLTPPGAQRREDMLSESPMRAKGTIEKLRVATRLQSFLAGQLSDEVGSVPAYSHGEGRSKDTPSVNIKQQLLHLLATEALLNKAVHGTHQIFATDMAWFGPSLAHKTILTVLKFFGLSKQWLSLFAAFLRTPLRLKDEETLRVRACGTPISYAMSALCGEVVLFVMDFAVNQRADGIFLYRNHDDLWLWDSKPDRVVLAWKEMNVWASIAGLTFNMDKTGSAFCGGDLDPSLPQGDVRWGFLKFDTEEARFVIDQKDVDVHIAELHRQLKAAKSVFGYVNGLNQYMAFLVRNFGGHPAVCLGQTHVDDMISTLARVQSELFPKGKGPVGYLREVLAERFNVVDDLPQGFFFLTIKTGGLELRDPMVELFALRKALADPAGLDSFEPQLESDVITYGIYKEQWGNASPRTKILRGARGDDPFMEFDEYVLGRESGIQSWGQLYQKNLGMPAPADVRETPAIRAMLSGGHNGQKWDEMGFYEKWILSLYGDALVKKFGSLEPVDPTLIPVGMVELFRNSRMKWEQ